MLVRLEDLHDCLRLIYDNLNNRPVVALQQSDVLALVAPSCFGEFFSVIHKEIDHLTGETASKSYIVPQDALTRINEMGYEFWPHQKPESLDSFSKIPIETRGQLIYDSLIDLLALRLEKKQTGWRNAWVVPESDALETERWEKVQKKLANLAKAIGYDQATPKVRNVAALEGVLIQMLPKMQEHWPSIKPKSGKGFPHLLIPKWNKNDDETKKWVALVDKLNNEYLSRKKVMLTRLNVTSQAFMWSDRARGHFDDFCGDLAGLLAWSEGISRRRGVSCYEVLSADKRLLAPKKISELYIASPLKKIQVGEVPNRGGVPEGFAIQDVSKDVHKANVALQQKDQPRRPPPNAAPAQSKSTPGATQWIGSNAAAAEPKRANTWKRSGPAAAAASQTARTNGGVYTGAQGSYSGNGRRRFPAGAFDPSLDNPQISSPPKSASPTSGGDVRRVFMDHSGASPRQQRGGGGGNWGGRPQDTNPYAGWNPRQAYQ